MKITLVFPPHWTPTMPHMALPTLASYLRAHGVEVVQRDLNVEVFDTILTREYLTQARNRLRQGQRSSIHHRGPPPEKVQWALSYGNTLASQIEEAMRVLRSDAFLDGPTGLQAFLTIDQSLELASLPFFPAKLGLLEYTPASPVDSSRHLLRAVRNARHNIFLEHYRQGILADLKRDPPDIVGISIATMDQMLAGMTLGYLIKRAVDSLTVRPMHVTVGGPHISMLRDQLLKVPAMFQCFDSAIAFDGEIPLLRLAETLDKDPHGDLSQVPNLIYKDGEQVRSTITQETICKVMEDPFLRPPDFEGLPLDRYLAPKLVLPLLTSRGCYHGRCAFCNVGYGAPKRFKQLTANAVVEQMMTLHRQYGVEHIFFADEAITPRTMRDMATALIKLGSPIHWCTCARFDKPLTHDFLAHIAQGGCRMLLFGLESASDKIIQRIDKGTTPERMGQILRDSAEAQIWNHTFFFFGFPGETMADAQETVNFVYAHQDAIHSASLGTFLLERYAPAQRFPRKYGIKRIAHDPTKDLAIYFDYEVQSGMDEAMAELVASRLLDTLPRKRFGHFYIHDVYRFLYVSDLIERGEPLPLWLVHEEIER
jgi:hypothetical protein